MTRNYSCCTYMSESAGHDGERGEPLLLRRDSFPRWGCYWFLPETASLLKPRPSGRRIQEVSDQTTWKFNWRWLSSVATLFPLNATCFIYSGLFHHSHSLDLQITSHLITDSWRWEYDSALDSPHDLLECRIYRCLLIREEKCGALLLFIQ